MLLVITSNFHKLEFLILKALNSRTNTAAREQNIKVFCTTNVPFYLKLISEVNCSTILHLSDDRTIKTHPHAALLDSMTLLQKCEVYVSLPNTKAFLKR